MPNYGCDNGRTHDFVYAPDLATALDKCRAVQPAAYPDFCYVIGDAKAHPADAEQCPTLHGAWRAAQGCCNFKGSKSCP